jgi:hypothetical protein
MDQDRALEPTAHAAARAEAAIKVLDELGYVVSLEKRSPWMTRPANSKPQLKVVPSPEDKSGSDGPTARRLAAASAEGCVVIWRIIRRGYFFAFDAGVKTISLVRLLMVASAVPASYQQNEKQGLAATPQRLQSGSHQAGFSSCARLRTSNGPATHR